MVGDKKTNKTSKMIKNSKLSDEELLNEILAKNTKRKKRLNNKKELPNQTTDKKISHEVSKSANKSINSQKKNTSTSSKSIKKRNLNSKEKETTTIKKTKSATVKNKKTTKKAQNKLPKHPLNDEELLLSILKQKQIRKKNNNHLLTSEKKEPTENLINAPNKDKNEIIKKSKIEKNDIQSLEKNVKKKKNDLIITRKITFDESYVNLKDKKTLKQLKEAIEEFDRVETLSEIAQSSDKINTFIEENSQKNTGKEKEETNLILTELNEESNLSNKFTTNKNELTEESLDKKEPIANIKHDDITNKKETENNTNLYFPATSQNQHNEDKKNKQLSNENYVFKKDLIEKESRYNEKLSLEKYLEQARASKNKKEVENKQNEQKQQLIENLLEYKKEENDYLKDYEYDNKSISKERIPNYQDKSEIRKKFLWRSCSFLFALLIFIFIISLALNNSQKGKSLNLKKDDVRSITVPYNREEELAEQYQDCLNKSINESDYTEELTNEINELVNYISSTYKASIKYEDLKTGFTYTYNEEEIYYAASTIKVLDALYLYQKAALNEISLNETIEYTSKYKYKSSAGMDQHKFGEKLSLGKLVEYAIIYSDNSAHQMLVDYIGRRTLKEFGQKLGAKHTLIGGDNFGNINVNDAIIYMKAVNDFINNNSNLGKELQNLMIKAEQNDLELPQYNILAAHKYGNYGYYYHDYGIVYDDSPYVIAILTTEGKGDYEAKVKDINNHIFQLHQTFINNRKQLCQAQIYK